MKYRFPEGGPSAARAFGVRLLGRVLAFLVAILLARELGVEEFGVYSYATNWVAILTVISGLGYGVILLRQTAIYRSLERPDLLVETIGRARRTIVGVALALSALAAVLAFVLVDEAFLMTLLLILPVVVVRGFGFVWISVLQGLGRTEESFLPTYVVYPVVMLAGVGLVVGITGTIAPEGAAVLYLFAYALGTGIVWLIGRARLRPLVADQPSDREPEKWQHPELLPMTAFTLLGTVEGGLGIVLLGQFDLVEAVGEFQVAIKLVEPITMVFLVLSLTLAPRITAAFSDGKLSDLQPSIRRNLRFAFLAAAPMAILIILGREPLLGLFGDGFEGGAASLTILACASAFNVFAGLAGTALVMTRHLKPALLVKGAGLVLNLILCLILIPDLGAAGAAIAMAAGIVVSNVWMAALAWRLLGLNTTVLPMESGR